MLLWAHILYQFCFEGSNVRTFPSDSEGWLTENCSSIGCKFLTISTESSQTSPQKSASNPFFLSQGIGFMKHLQLWPWVFLSFTAPFVCESHHLRSNRQVPQKAVLFHVLAAFRLVVLLYYKLIWLLWDDGTHLSFCFTSLPRRTTVAIHTTCACAPPALAVNCMATFRAYMAHGVPSLQRSVRSLLISSVSLSGLPAEGMPRACYFVGWQNKPLPSCYEPNAMAHEHKTHQNRVLPFHRRLSFCGNAFPWIQSSTKSFPSCELLKVCIEILS